MFVNEVNEVKIYNLSAGKSVPEWLTDRRKRLKSLKNIDSRRQIELIQDFDMPGVCTCIRMSPDQQYILAIGTYKPRFKCYEVCNLSIKFERCFDSEVTTFETISDDYSKLAFLHCDRYIEIHIPSGRHYRLRIPRFGRDMKYHKPSCDLYIVGNTSEIYRLNLERGQFLQPYDGQGTCFNVAECSEEHGLLLVGSKEGCVEAWDPRIRQRCAILDVARKLPDTKFFPSISSIKFKDALHVGIGTNSGHVLLYDIRSREPLLIKDHLNKLPVKRLAFNTNNQAVYSLDDAMLKLWHEQTGKQIAYIEAKSTFNDFCTVNGSGLIFMAQEDVKMLTYYIPAMGPAPKWCSFLDNLTEEIESDVVENVYDDYQFVTQKELEELGLDHLIGSNLLKAYMHGYFMDVRLYNRAKAIVDPFAYERYRKEKIRQQIDNERMPRLQMMTAGKLPKVNQELALKIIEEQATITTKGQKSQKMPNLLQDTRFTAMFENPDFAIDKTVEEYKLLAPVLNRLEKTKLKKIKKRVEIDLATQLQAEENKPQSHDSDNDEDLFGLDNEAEDDSTDSDGEASTDDENAQAFKKEIKKAYKDVKQQRKQQEEEQEQQQQLEEMEKNIKLADKLNPIIQSTNTNSFQFHRRETNFKVIPLENTSALNQLDRGIMKRSLKERVATIAANELDVQTIGHSSGNRQMSFDMRKPPSKAMKKREQQMKLHREERKHVIRPINSLKLKKVHFK